MQRRKDLENWCIQFMDKNKNIIVFDETDNFNGSTLEKYCNKVYNIKSSDDDLKNLGNVNFMKITLLTNELRVLVNILNLILINNYPPLLIKCEKHVLKDTKTYFQNMGYKYYELNGYDDTYLFSDNPIFIKQNKEEWVDIYEKAKQCRLNSKNQECYDLCVKGLQIVPVEKEYLFNEEIAICAFYVNKKMEGLSAANKVILCKFAPWGTRNLALSNAGFYMKPLEVKKCYDVKCKIPRNFSLSTPSIVNTQNGFRINARCINYYIDNGSYRFRDGSSIVKTTNIVCEVDKNFDTIKQVELVDNSGLKLYPKNILGMEDVRLFGNNYFFCTYLEMNTKCTPQIGWGTFDVDTGSVNRMVPLSLTPEIQCEKNWLPFMIDDEIHFIYSFNPLIICKLDKTDCSITIVHNSILGDKFHEENPFFNNIASFIDDFRGSAPPILYKNHWIATIHQVNHNRTRKYFHRFVVFSYDFTKIKFSELFYFEKVGVEFNLSLCLSDDGMIITYSCNDNSCKIAVIDFDYLDNFIGL